MNELLDERKKPDKVLRYESSVGAVAKATKRDEASEREGERKKKKRMDTHWTEQKCIINQTCQSVCGKYYTASSLWSISPSCVVPSTD